MAELVQSARITSDDLILDGESFPFHMDADGFVIKTSPDTGWTVIQVGIIVEGKVVIEP